MTKEDKEKLIRVYILDTLVSQSGKSLVPEIIGQLTEEILTRVKEVLDRDEEYK
jgi:flagellar basal body-associated protein FliL